MESTQGNAPGFTPGPWVVDDDGTADQSMPHPDWTAVGLSDEDGFAEVVAYCAPANAALLAAAPDLLAALREILDAAEIEADEADLALRALDAIRPVARAALAKAEGRQA